MDMITRDEFDDLLGAYALDACEPDEIAAIETFLAAHPETLAVVERLREAAVWLGASSASVPPVAIRANVVDAARRVRSAAASAPLDAYRAEVERLHATLRGLTEADAERMTHNGLTIRELVLHLGVAERTLAAELVQAHEPSWDDALMRRITAIELEDAGHATLTEAIARWRDATGTVVDLALHADHAVAGWSVGDLLVIRAFETWTHHDDISLAIGRDESAPVSNVLQSMVAFSTRMVPWALAAQGATREHTTAALRLTGAVEGIWIVGLAPGSDLSDAPIVELTLDAIDWCKRFADRRGGDVERHVQGDASIGDDLIAAAPAFAGL